MHVTTMFFAQARERAGASHGRLELPQGSSVADALAALAHVHRDLAPLLPIMAVAVDGVLARPETLLHEGAELALLPPVSGG